MSKDAKKQILYILKDFSKKEKQKIIKDIYKQLKVLPKLYSKFNRPKHLPVVITQKTYPDKPSKPQTIILKEGQDP